MRNATQLTTSYIQTALFLLLAARCILSWNRAKDQRSAHLALATSLYGLNSLMSAINNTIYNSLAGERPPRWESVVSTIILYAAVYAFLLFLSDFVHFPSALKWLAAATTVVNMFLAIFIQADTKFVRGRLVITHRGYILYVLFYLAAVFAVLGLTFLFYGLRVQGLARFRLVMIGLGFSILFVVIGLLPLLLFENPTATQLRSLTTALSYIVLITVPMLYVGFAPPKFIVERFGAPQPVLAPR